MNNGCDYVISSMGITPVIMHDSVEGSLLYLEGEEKSHPPLRFLNAIAHI